MRRSTQTATPELFAHFHAVAMASPMGKVWVESDGELITRLSFVPLRVRQARTPKVLVEARKQLDAYFKRRRKQFDLPLQTTMGTRFQRMTWEALNDIRWGDTRTYQQIADRIGGKAIARTVGNACASNPIPIIVPCHRVIASNGLLTGYVGGLWRKRWLLEHEGVLTPGMF